jgi:hypothetical protein
MTRWHLTFIAGGILLATPLVAQAAKERCRVKEGDELRLIDRTYSRLGCELEGRKYLRPRRCASGDRKFQFKYTFDGEVYEGEGYCLGSSHDPSSSGGKERCRVEDGDEMQYLPRTFTRGVCAQEAKHIMGPKLCNHRTRKFFIKYEFDDVTYHDSGYCSVYD